MDAVEKRVADRMRAERKRLQDEQMKLGKRRLSVAKQVEKALEAQGKLIGLLKLGKLPKPVELEKAALSRHSVDRAVRELTQNARRCEEIAGLLAAIEDGSELNRRVKLARDLGIEEPVPGPEAAKIVLLHEGHEMDVNAISRTMLETGIVKLSGKTPEQTISAYLAKAASKGDTFVRVSPATYDLKDRDGAVVPKATPEAAAPKASAKVVSAKA